ncbi:NAD(P)/FAD-dependent oxidoreductase [Methylobacterium trifolii]|uniref:Thioredoxin reductase n=1 Tax=Methylobacterium trifolii TaxID=1003092 RepID=A0ABQ4TXR6_9HYPH|nr:NAD(P)/FAD-dependent oxidoreductase [Methylobacterium trifolii]GJE59493.1 Thioredoxin reductase [Methylobacterium trifolii]
MRDVIIVGGGPAGLNAALILGRCRRDVLLCDKGEPRNAAAPLTWGLFTRDGTPPFELRARAEADLDRYDTVERRGVEVVGACRTGDAFAVDLSDGTQERARRLILATGLHQDLPAIDGFARFWGTGVHTCPYCDGYEARDRPVAVYAHGPGAKGIALEMTAWSRDVSLCTDGRPTDLDAEARDRLSRNGVRVVETRIARLDGTDDGPTHLVLADGTRLPCRAVFLMPEGCRPSDLIRSLGCDLTDAGVVPTRDYERTNVPGLFVAGDASRRVQFAVVAAAEGAMAAFAVNTELLREDTR